jgi:hypothetical protein
MCSSMCSSKCWWTSLGLPSALNSCLQSSLRREERLRDTIGLYMYEIAKTSRYNSICGVRIHLYQVVSSEFAHMSETT